MSHRVVVIDVATPAQCCNLDTTQPNVVFPSISIVCVLLALSLLQSMSRHFESVISNIISDLRYLGRRRRAGRPKKNGELRVMSAGAYIFTSFVWIFSSMDVVRCCEWSSSNSRTRYDSNFIYNRRYIRLSSRLSIFVAHHSQERNFTFL
jgi:hypothetical protein